jgi:hypothetical protein
MRVMKWRMDMMRVMKWRMDMDMNGESSRREEVREV